MGAAKKSPNDVFRILARFGMTGEFGVGWLAVDSCRDFSVGETSDDAIEERNLVVFFGFDRELDAWVWD